MHAGNIFAALVAWLVVRKSSGTMVLRIEDLDRERSKQHYIDQVQRDFEQLGLTWDKGPYYQHDRDEAYQRAFEKLAEANLLYPCFCTRAELHAQSAPHRGEKLVYAGTCRNLTKEEIARRTAQRTPAWRVRVPDNIFAFTDIFQGPYSQNLAHECGDYLVKRSDGAFAYQLAVVVDDAASGITNIVRGVDLITSTPQQLYLQEVLGVAHPSYGHVPLLVAQKDRRLSKRDHDASIDALMESFGDARGVLGRIAYRTGLIDVDEPAWAEELLEVFDQEAARAAWQGVIQIPWYEDGAR